MEEPSTKRFTTNTWGPLKQDEHRASTQPGMATYCNTSDVGQAEETLTAGHHAGVGNSQADEGRWGNGDQTWLYELQLWPVACCGSDSIQWMAGKQDHPGTE